LICGRRADMSRRWSEALTLEAVRSGAFEHIGLREWFDSLSGAARYLEEAIHIRNRFLGNILHGKKRGLLGCNFSIHKSDLVAINGFDELYAGPGFGEDADIEYRLGLQGITPVILRHRATQFHLHHPRTTPAEANSRRYREVLKTGNPRCARGLVSEA
jgi:hypothetical protein